MKNNQNLVSFSPKKGVYLYFADSNMTDIIDIDVEPGIRSIVLSGPNANRNRLSRNVKLRNIFKQFPDLEELVIQEDIIHLFRSEIIIFAPIYANTLTKRWQNSL